jgi:hypothetical protein
MIVYIFNSNTSNSTIPQQQSAKDRMRHILMAVPEVEPVCCRCFGISYSGRVTTPAYSCILEGTYNRKAVLKCMIGLFEFRGLTAVLLMSSRLSVCSYNRVAVLILSQYDCVRYHFILIEGSILHYNLHRRMT